MTATARRDHLLELIVGQVSSWSPERRQANGFDLMIGEPDQLRRLHRAHARTVLCSEAELIKIAADRTVLMKGLEVAQLYPTPLQRPFRDLDLLLSDPLELWESLVTQGYRADPSRRRDIDHHHLPALAAPCGVVGLELHHRPNVPAWARLPAEIIIDTAVPSRTGIAGIRRPRDDLHALLLAMHGWKGGFTRLRDLFDALLLAAVSDIPVEETAAKFRLGRFWRWTTRIAEAELLGRATVLSRGVTRAAIPRGGRPGRKRSRLLTPYLVADPVRVTLGHISEYRLGRAARLPPTAG